MLEKTIIVMQANHWGRGASIKEATKECVKAGGKRSAKATAMVVMSDAEKDKPYINDFGNVCYFQTEDGNGYYLHLGEI